MTPEVSRGSSCISPVICLCSPDREDPLFLEGEGEIVRYERLRIGHPESIISV